MQEKQKKMKGNFPVAGIHFENKHIQQPQVESSWERVKGGFSFEISNTMCLEILLLFSVLRWLFVAGSYCEVLRQEETTTTTVFQKGYWGVNKVHRVIKENSHFQ